MAPAVHLRAAVALIGGFPALAGADLDVEEGSAVLLQGANGAGKTSVLRVCAGLLPVSSGEAVVLGCDLRRDRRAVRRSVGMIGHAAFCYDDLTAAENVAFALRAAGTSTHRLDVALEIVGLTGRLRDSRASHLSAGQRRRLSLATLWARRPRLWLLDEPHAGLDSDGRYLVDTMVRDALSDGSTVLIASHETSLVSALVPRSLTVAGGQVHDPVRRAPAVEPAHVA